MCVTATVLVVVPDLELRRSIEFALDAEGFAIESHTGLSSALGAGSDGRFVCTVVDENAIANRNGQTGRLDSLAGPVVLLVDRLRLAPEPGGVRVLTKPLLGRVLVDTVAGMIAEGARGGGLRSFP